MNKTFKSFLTLQGKDRKDFFEQAAKRLYTEAGHIEKDFWVCPT